MKTFWSVVVGFCIVVFALVFFAWNFVPSWVSKALSNKAGVPVSISHLTLTPKNIGVYDLKVKNPKGSTLDYALKAKKITSKANVTTYFHQNITIDYLELDKIYLGLEFNSTRSSDGNWTTIMNNLRSSLKDDQATAGPKKKVLIKKLVVKNLNIDLVFKQGNKGIQHLKPIKHMEFDNVSSEGGLPTAQIMNLIMSQVLKEVFSKENIMNMLKNSIETPGKGASGFFDDLKHMFSKLEETKLEKIH